MTRDWLWRIISFGPSDIAPRLAGPGTDPGASRPHHEFGTDIAALCLRLREAQAETSAQLRIFAPMLHC